MELKDWRRLLSPSGPLAEGYVADPDALTRGNRLTLLSGGGEAFPAMREAISQARHSVHLECYKIGDDATGWRFARCLAERAKAGVAVRVIFDAIGSMGLSAKYLQYLRNHGAQLLEYHPVAPWRPRWAWGRRDHRKILVVDGRVAFSGGMNLNDNYAGPDEGGSGWRDFQIRSEGPAAYELDRLFRQVWYKHTRRWYTSDADPRHRPGSSLAQVAANQEFLKRYFIRRALIHAIDRAKERISIAICYFIPDRKFRKALYRAARRDVKVRILVPEISDVPAVSYASWRLYEEMLREGLRIYALDGPTLHAKAIAIDNIWSSVGSYNITHRSLMHNLEVNLHVLDSRFSKTVDAAISEHISQSREILLEDWLGRSWKTRLAERFFFWLRHWF